MSAFVPMLFVAAFASSRSKRARTLARIAIVFVCTSLVFARVRADDRAAETAPAEAIEHYERGRAHYKAGRYREAVVELERALELDPGSANLVYNLARVYELLGEIELAMTYYEQYRAMLPEGEGEERARVSNAIERLEGAKRHAPRAPPPSQVRPGAVRTERGVADGAFWTLASISLAALAAGGVTGVLALRAERDARGFVLGRDGDDRERRQLGERADRLAITSDATLSAGVLVGLTSILLYALRTRPVVEPGVAFVPNGFTLSLRGEL